MKEHARGFIIAKMPEKKRRRTSPLFIKPKLATMAVAMRELRVPTKTLPRLNSRIWRESNYILLCLSLSFHWQKKVHWKNIRNKPNILKYKP